MAILDDIVGKLPAKYEKLKGEIEKSLEHLPESINGEYTLTTLKKIVVPNKSNAQASSFSPQSGILTLTPPFSFDMETYLSLDKQCENQRFLMDVGTFVGLHSLSYERGNDKFKPLCNELSAMLKENENGCKDYWIKNINRLKNVVNINSCHIMAGVSDFNCYESLFQWTIRHEIGHAVDAMIRWNYLETQSQLMFGGWTLYGDDDAAYEAYCADVKNKELMLQKSDFIDACIDYPFTYNEGGNAKSDNCIFMLDEYGRWCSYLSSARIYSVSNYQFASHEEWFAEAFAAYYGPRSEDEIVARLGQAVCDYFATKVGKRRSNVN